MLSWATYCPLSWCHHQGPVPAEPSHAPQAYTVQSIFGAASCAGRCFAWWWWNHRYGPAFEVIQFCIHLSYKHIYFWIHSAKENIIPSWLEFSCQPRFLPSEDKSLRLGPESPAAIAYTGSSQGDQMSCYFICTCFFKIMSWWFLVLCVAKTIAHLVTCANNFCEPQLPLKCALLMSKTVAPGINPMVEIIQI